MLASPLEREGGTVEVEPSVVYMLVASSVLLGAVVGSTALLLARKVIYRRAIRRLVLEATDGRRNQAVANMELNDDERGWLEAHGIDAS